MGLASNAGWAPGSPSELSIPTCYSFAFYDVIRGGGVERGEIAVGSRVLFRFEYAKGCVVGRGPRLEEIVC